MNTATIAWCNDIDFADWATYQATHHELHEEFGITAEDSFWLFDPAGGEMALFHRSLREKGPRHDDILAEVREGRLAILHSAGNFDTTTGAPAPTRGQIAEALDYLAEHARVPAVWTNHGDEGNVQNIGYPGSGYQQGDVPGSDAYILDLLLQHGVRYFWTDRLTSNDFVFHRDASRGQTILRQEPTRAGFTITGFVRFRGALPKAPDAETLAWQLNEEHLDRLIAARGVVVIYQHWCVHRDAERRPYTAGRPVFPGASHAALRRLARQRDRGTVRILSTRELLDECAAHELPRAA